MVGGFSLTAVMKRSSGGMKRDHEPQDLRPMQREISREPVTMATAILELSEQSIGLRLLRPSAGLRRPGGSKLERAVTGPREKL